MLRFAQVPRKGLGLLEIGMVEIWLVIRGDGHKQNILLDDFPLRGPGYSAAIEKKDRF